MMRLFLWLCVLLAGEVNGGSAAATLPAPGRHSHIGIHTSSFPTQSSQDL